MAAVVGVVLGVGAVAIVRRRAKRARGRDELGSVILSEETQSTPAHTPAHTEKHGDEAEHWIASDVSDDLGEGLPKPLSATRGNPACASQDDLDPLNASFQTVQEDDQDLSSEAVSEAKPSSNPPVRVASQMCITEMLSPADQARKDWGYMPGTPTTSFEVRTHSPVQGATVCVVGAAPELGAWNTSSGIRMHQAQHDPYLWTATVFGDIRGTEYKYVTQTQAGSYNAVFWEHGENRWVAHHDCHADSFRA